MDVTERANAERRIVTTLFADLEGSTDLSARLDAEDLDAVLAGFFEAMDEIILRFGGVVEKYIGDAIAAYFGTQRAFGDDATRAVRAGLAMQRRLDVMRTEEGHRFGALGMRIGIETGEVLVVPDRATERIATGQSLNIAARIQSAAEPGTVLVGERAALQSSGDIRYAHPRSIVAKGMPGKVVVRQALGDQAAAGGTTPFVGREHQVTRLGDLLAGVGPDAGAVIFVSGPRGSGRSRLVEHARNQADGRLLWLEARARETTSTAGYPLFVDLLRSWLGLGNDLPAAAERQALATELESILKPDTAAGLAPVLSALFDPGEVRSASLPGDVVGRQVFLAVLTFFAELCARRPVGIVVDDLDAADDDSLRLLAHVATLTRTHPLAIVAVCPDQPESHLADALDQLRAAGSTPVGDIALAPLDGEEARRLVSTLLPDAGHEVVAAVVERGSGEPYLLEQFAAAVAVAGSDAPSSVPDNVRGALQARLDTLDGPVKERLRAAAVYGGDVTADVLAVLVDVPSEPELAALIDLGYLRPVPGVPGAARFADPLVREVTYEAVPKARRAVWHERAARFLEEHAPTSHAALAFHYAGSGNQPLARDALVRAGDDAGSIAADSAALGHYRAALDAAGGDGWDPIERSSLERKIGEALLRRGAYDRARGHLERGLEIIGDPYPASVPEIRRRSATGLARILPGGGSPAGEAAARELAAEHARLYARMGWVDYFRDGDRFFLDALRTVRFGSRAGNTVTFETVQGLMGVGVGLDVNGNGGLAARFHRRALVTAEAAGDDMALGFAHLGACVHEHHLTGDWDAALHHARAGMAAFSEVGASHEWGTIAYLAAWITAGRGGFTEALQVCEQMLLTARDTGDRHLAAWATEAVGRVALLAGSPGDAFRILRKAEAPLAAIPDNMNWARARAEAIQSQTMVGDLDGASEALASTERFVEVHDVRGFYRAELAVARARLALAGGGHGGVTRLDPASAVAAAGKAARHDWEGRVESLRLAGALALTRGRTKVAVDALERANRVAGRLGSPLHQVVVSRDRWRITGDRNAVGSLRSSFAALGLEFDSESGDFHPDTELRGAIDGLSRAALVDG